LSLSQSLCSTQSVCCLRSVASSGDREGANSCVMRIPTVPCRPRAGKGPWAGRPDLSANHLAQAHPVRLHMESMTSGDATVPAVIQGLQNQLDAVEQDVQKLVSVLD